MVTGRIVAFAAAGLLSMTGAAVAAPAAQYGGPTSQRFGSSALRITISVRGEALVGVLSVDAEVKQGGAACSVGNGGENAFDFNKGSVRIDSREALTAC